MENTPVPPQEAKVDADAVRQLALSVNFVINACAPPIGGEQTTAKTWFRPTEQVELAPEQGNGTTFLVYPKGDRGKAPAIYTFTGTHIVEAKKEKDRNNLTVAYPFAHRNQETGEMSHGHADFDFTWIKEPHKDWAFRQPKPDSSPVTDLQPPFYNVLRRDISIIFSAIVASKPRSA